MNNENIKYYILKSNDHDIHVQIHPTGIVRVTYDEKGAMNNTDACVIAVVSEEAPIITNEITLKDLKIRLNDKGLIRFEDAAGSFIMEDIGLRESCKDEYHEFQEQEYEVINRDKDKIYAYELKRRLQPDAGYYGMGEKYGFINFYGRSTENWNTDVLGVSPIHTSGQLAYHTSIPFYIEVRTTHAYGVFHDTSYHNYFDFGKYSDSLTVRAEGGVLDYYFMYGSNVAKVVESYTALTGRAKLPRRDYLGYQQCRWSYMTSEEVIGIARTFREKGIPLDVMYLDIDYMQDYKVFTWNEKRFSDFKKMLKILRDMWIKVVVIIDPGIKKEEGYHAYESGIDENCFIKDEHGDVYIGEVWPGKSAFPNFLEQRVKEWWKNLHEDLITDGVTGLWNDMNEIADMSTTTKTVPETTYHEMDSGELIYQSEAHNIYGHHHAKASYESMIGLAPRVRPFVLTRAASSGTQRYSTLWTGDNTSIWEHLEMSIPMLLNLGLSGYAYTGSDIGGFVGDGEAELLERWMQLGVFYPLCRNHSCMNSLMQEPWAFGTETEEVVTKYIRYRYTLVSHLYQLFWEHKLTGAPIMRPLFYHYQDDPKTYNINDEFLFGENILVAPIIRPKTFERLVYLPKGNWYHESSKKWYAGSASYIIEAKRDDIPIFTRAGSMRLVNEVKEYINESFEDELELHVYHGEDQVKRFYFDDGISFDYQNSSVGIIEVRVDGDKITQRVIQDGYRLPKIKIVEIR